MVQHELRAIVETRAFPLSRGKMQAHCWKVNVSTRRDFKNIKYKHMFIPLNILYGYVVSFAASIV